MAIPQIAAQPPSGRRLNAFPAGFLPDGSIMGTAGDYGPNSGPIDVFSISPAGVVSTHLEQFDTEEITHWRNFADGSVWASAVDPRLNGIAELATNRGGWRTIQAQPPGVGNAVHLFDVDEVAPGVIGTCGSRGPDTAIVWESTDGGDTWIEVLAHNVPNDGFQRFYTFRRDDQGRPIVDRHDGTAGYWTRTGTGWVYSDGLPTIRVERLVFTAAPTGIATEVRLDGQLLRVVPGPSYNWTGAVAPDGSVWLSNRTALYRIPPLER